MDTIDAHGATQSIVQTQYAPCACSPLGKVSAVSQPHAPGATAYWTTYTYDGIGRTVSVLAPDGASATTYLYAGNTVTVTDPAGKWKKFTMDAFGNLTSVVEPDATQTNTGGVATTTYAYDVLNHLINVNMPRQMPGGNTVTQQRTFTYSGPYLTSATNPENGTVYYYYNSDGTMSVKWDAKGQAAGYFLWYLYDSYGRLTTMQTMSGTPLDYYGTPTVLRTYSYDLNNADGSFSQNALGRLTTVGYNVPSASTAYDSNGHAIAFTNDLVTEMYSYSIAGQVAGKRLRVARNGLNSGGSPVTISADLNGTWSYNNEGDLTGAGYPGGGPSYTYSYNGLAQLSGMTGTDGNNVAGVSYNASGQLLTMNSESRSYNTMGQLTGINAGGASPVNMIYAYSSNQNNGKITSQTDNLTGENVTYAYDSLNRLIAAQAGGTWGQGFNYDPFGNLTAKTALAGTVPTLSVVVDPTTNRLYNTDANGNSLAIGSNYDVENRIIHAPGSNSYGNSYAYDARNKRIWTCAWANDDSGCQTEAYYFYSPQGKLMAQYTPYDAPPSGGSTNPSLAFTLASTRVYFGSRLLGNEDRVGSRGKYFPYGEARSGAQPDQVDFASYTRDSQTGLDYADQRFYSSAWGRFVTPDPYVATATSPSDPKMPGSWNRYAYVQGDPITYSDPRGRNIVVGDCGDLINGADQPGCDDGGDLGGGDGGGDPCAGNSLLPIPNPLCPAPVGPPAAPPPAPTSTSCTDWGCMPPAFARAIQALTLDPDCMALFGTAQTRSEGFNPTVVLTNIVYGSHSFGSIHFAMHPPNWGVAETRPAGLLPIPGLSGKVSITINELSSYGFWNYGDSNENAETLLHELGHVFNDLRGAGGFALPNSAERADPRAFDALIQQKCF